MPESIGTLNPKIREVVIGIRELKKIKIYPLSVRDHLDAKEMVVDTLAALFNGYEDPKNMENTEFLSRFMTLLSTNLDKIIKLVTDSTEGDVLDDIDVEQAVEIGNIIYEVNYSFLSKTAGPLIKKIKKVLDLPETESQLSILSPKSAERTDTNQESSMD